MEEPSYLTSYVCETEGCPFQGLEYSVHEGTDKKPLVGPIRCDNSLGCQKKRKRLADTCAKLTT